MTSAVNDLVSRVNIDPFSPPEMKTLVYSPDVQVFVEHNGRQYDISKDVVRVTVIRKENSASSVFVSVANKGGRYSGKVAPMDRITVFMKRFKWTQVLSGYVDKGPHSQLYQGVSMIKATCTLKRLMHTRWNPGLPGCEKFFGQMGAAQANAGDGQTLDSGFGSLLRQLLMEVGGWQPSNIHIQNFPVSFYNFLTSQVRANAGANQAAVEKFKHLLLGDDISSGAKSFANYSSSAGTPGPIGAGQAFYVGEIIAACDELGLGPLNLNLQTAQQLQEAAAQGAAGATSGLDPNQSAAWEGVAEAATNLQQSSSNSDGAILGIACALGESGLRNLPNPEIPESFQLPHDPYGGPYDHDSVGLFQQRNFAEWGTVQQRMNPRQSARMFFQHLAGIEGWRNMDPGQAIYRVQRGGSPSYYSSFIAQAKELVAAHRAASQAAATTITSNPITGAVSGVAGAAGINVGPSLAAAVGQATTSPDPAAARAQLGKPNPDSEGAVQTALQYMSTPYHWGGKTPAAGFDCSGLMTWAYKAIGIDIGHGTSGIRATVQQISPSQIQRGDIIIRGSGGGTHAQMYYEPGAILDTGGPEGRPGSLKPMAPLQPGDSVHHVCDNGGPDPSSPRLDPALVSNPLPTPGTGAATGLGGGAGGSHSEPIARNLFSYIFEPSQYASDIAPLWGMAGGHKDFIDSQPLMQMVQAFCRASMRNFQSAPNGDFIAYYPDYFGLDGKPAVMRLEDIELKDVHIDVSDDNLATHVYVAGQSTMLGQLDQVSQWLDTAGTATVEDEWLFQRIRKVSVGDYSATDGEDIMRKFGVRPYQVTQSLTGSYELEFLLACQIFMEKWAAQYETQVSFAFMPELFPGMRIQIGDHNLQVYVSEVVHDCDFEQGFRTTATIMAPSNPKARQQMADTRTDATNTEATRGGAGGPVLSGEELH
ncbi:minor tail protein [Mycobacterium phage Phrappuccino]|uniref:Minor tail protein n=1 Tax=Mycobacterium phage Phrappuccino TaxID=2591223 RepID=A0A514DDT6_9CAUD|nr:virion structural protein [Mycobacterium phage Phrappuccino]QDH91757.1 minor tail protein [Mycobacterium phage Phrappuccino]